MTEQTPGTDVVFARASLQDRVRWAQEISQAGDLVPKGYRDGNRANPAKVLLAAETGSMLGIHPIAALNGIHVIEGKPTISAGLMSALVRRAGHKLRVTTKGSVKDGTFEAIAVLIRADDPTFEYRSVWDKERATRAGLISKDVWKKYFEAMAKSRAISEVVKEGAEDVLMGNVYTAEELGAEVNEDGEIIQDAEIVEQDHDGPNVTTTMREPAPVKAQPKRAEPKPAAPITRAHAEVLTEWASRIGEINDLDALIKLHAEAADRHVLDHRDTKGTSIEDVFLARRETILAAQAQESAADGGSEDYADSYAELPF